MKRILASLAVILAIVLLLMLKWKKEGTEQAEIVYAGSAWYGHAPVWAGLRQGIFEKHGFKVRKEAFGGSADRISNLAADNAQFASLGEVAMLAAMARDNRDFYWIGCHNIAPGNEGLVAVGVDSIEGLKGKKIAIYENTSVHLTVALLLKQAGLDIRKDVEILNAQDSAVVDLVRNGDAVAGAMWEPFYTDLKGLDGAKLLGTDMDTSIYKQFKMMTGPDVLCASRKWVDADPERAKKFFRAYFEAVQWCADHPEELVQIVVDEVRKPEKEVRAALKNFKWNGWGAQKAMLSDQRMFGQAKAVSELLIELGRMDRVPAYREWTKVDWYDE
ncbi:MAG: ABC transporter substrate-binding protein [Planctomycetota bacterium]|jgi:ABC-type nitrate/sulfonate/bicarbonate transport system substrate-binding protein